MYTLPNIITLLRILLTPVFIALLLRYGSGAGEQFRIAALVVFAVAAGSDALDGMIARLTGRKSRFGACLDPVADKFLLLSAVILLSHPIRDLAVLPMWFLLLVIGRDVIILTGSSIIRMRAGRLTPTPSIAGKCTTFLQLACIFWILLCISHTPFIIIPTALFTLVSGIGYIRQGISKLSGEHNAF